MSKASLMALFLWHACAAAAATSIGAARGALLAALPATPTGASRAEQQTVNGLIDRLVRAAPRRSASLAGQLDGSWELLYTDAPDITSLDSSPANSLRRVGQVIDEEEGTVANVIEYAPPGWAAAALGGVASDDLVQQRVLLSYEYRPQQPTVCDLKLRGTGLKPQRVLGVDLRAAAPLSLVGPLSLPFGSFEVLYCEPPGGAPGATEECVAEALGGGDDEPGDVEGDVEGCVVDGLALRIVRTQQGYYSINRRMPIGQGWDD